MMHKVIAVSALLLLTATPQQGGQSKRENQQRDASALPLRPTTYTKDSENAGKKCEHTSKPHLSCEQISAQAAIDQAAYARKQTLISLFSAIVGLATLVAAGFAAWYAREAATQTANGAGEARRSADISQAGVDEARRIGQAQVRAYVSVSEPEITFLEDGTVTLTSNIRNTGQSPALHLKCSYLVELSQTGKPPEQQIAGLLLHGKRVDVSSGETFPTPKQRLSEGLNETVAKWATDDTLFIVSVTILSQWKDVFDVEHDAVPRFATFMSNWSVGSSFTVPREEYFVAGVVGEIALRRHKGQWE